jgi:ketosteroid isomerase-like protein
MSSSSSDKQLIQGLEARLQILEDREAIRDVMNQYVMRPDYKDWKGYANLYVEDGVMGFDQWGDAVGREAIEKIVAREEVFEGLQHLTTNPDITLEGVNATVICRLWFSATPKLSKPKDNFSFGGPYRFTLVKRDDGWKIKTMHLQTMWSIGIDTLKVFPIDLSQ